MLRATLALALSVMCCLLGPPQTNPAGATRAEKPLPAAETLRKLRKPIHEWLERDVAEKTRAENRAYADLILTFGLARAGDTDEAKRLLGEATAVLEKGDAAHQCMLGLYRHRIEQVLAGKSPVGPLPAKLLAPVTPTGNEGLNAPIKMHHYIVLRIRDLSRVIDPLEQVDPYLPWMAKGVDDPLVTRLGPLQDEQDPERFATDARKLLKDTGSGTLETRLRVTTRLAALAPRAGEAFCVGLLKGVPDLIREGRKADAEALRAGTIALVEQSLTLSVSLKKPELFKPLVAESVELIKTEQASASSVRVTSDQLFPAAARRAAPSAASGSLPTVFLRNPFASSGSFRTRNPRSQRVVRRAIVVGVVAACIRKSVGQDADAAELLALVRDVVLDPPATDRGVAYYRLVAEYAAAGGRMPPVDGRKRLEELFNKLGKVPDAYTTATHYSRYHLMILEAAVLGLTSDDDF